MNKIRLWFYLADKADDSSIDDIIAVWTQPFNKGTPPYSHVEIEFSDGWMFSSTLRGKSKGTRFALKEDIIKHRERWHCYSKEYPHKREQLMRQDARRLQGRPYAKAGVVLSFLLPFGYLGTAISRWLKHWYCSLVVFFLLIRKIRRISPRRLSEWAIKNGFVREE